MKICAAASERYFLCLSKCVAASENISMFFKERAAASERILRKMCDCFFLKDTKIKCAAAS